MSFSPKTIKMLWGRSASRCAICKAELVMDGTASDDPSVVGDNCHIVADSPDGPRGDPTFPPEKLGIYDNLVLLCKIHHKLIDDQPNTYTVEELHKAKSAHEAWVRQQLELYDAKRQADDERYATIIEEWEKRAQVDKWQSWTSFLFGDGQPRIAIDRFDALVELDSWLFKRIWPKRYLELDEAFSLFRRVSNDFCSVFRRHASPVGDWFWTEKFYKIDDWNPEKYERLHRDFENHVGIIEDLMLELTRAGNLICDRIREHVIADYRLERGVLSVMRGPGRDFNWTVSRPEYSAAERASDPYISLNHFRNVRTTRDQCVGDVSDVE